MSERVYTLFQQSVAAKMQVGEALGPSIEQAADCIVQAFLQERKILICGDGTSAPLAKLFANYLIEGCEKERPSLPAIDLSNSVMSHDMSQANAVRALTQRGDVMLSICGNGNSNRLMHAAQAATAREAQLIALTGCDGGLLGRHILDHQGTEIRANLFTLTHIHEIHLLIIHCLCDLIDHRLFGID